MKLNRLLLVLPLLLILGVSMSLTLADSEEKISISGDFDKIIQSNETANFRMLLKNLDAPGKLQVSYVPSKDWNISISDNITRYSPYFTLTSGSEKELSFNISPAGKIDVGTYSFLFNILAEDGTPEANFTLKVSISEDVAPIMLIDLDMEHRAYPGKTFPFTLTLKNNDFTSEPNVKIIVESDIFEEQFSIVKTFRGKEEKSISGEVVIKSFLDAGNYPIEITAFNSGKYKIYSGELTVPAEGSLVVTKSSDQSFLKGTYTLTLTNLGNYPLKDEYYLKMGGLSRMFTFIEPEPNRVESGNGRVYVFTVDLAPRQDKIITYTVSYIPLIVILIIVAAAILWFVSRRSCSISKSISRTADKDIRVRLTIKNNSLKTVNNLSVEDTVPMSMKVIRDVGNVPDITSRRGNGLVLTWRVAKLAPREERTISYKIKPVIKFMGRSSLPHASLSLKTGKRLDRYISNSVQIKSK